MANNGSKFNAPIPGESLAHPPGSFPWERPPQFTKPEEALDFIWKNLIKTSQMPKMLALLENGATVADITKGTLVSGFQKGLWSIDVMMLIDKNVFLMVASIAEKAGIKYELIPQGGPGNVDSFISELNLNLMKANMTGKPEDVNEAFNEAANQPPGINPEEPGAMSGGNPTGQPPQVLQGPPTSPEGGNGMFGPPPAQPPM